MPKHPTPAQREASRRNGGKSHGPHDTSQTRFNALKHGAMLKRPRRWPAERREGREGPSRRRNLVLTGSRV